MPDFAPDAFNGVFSLFPAKEKKSEKSPDHTGSIELPIEQAMRLAEWITTQPGESNWQGEKVVKIRLAGWSSTSDKGLNYVRGKVSPPMATAPTAPSDLPF